MMMSKVESWVVYRLSIHGKPETVSAVCAAAEWAEIERLNPGKHALIKSGIFSEGEAERLARGTSGDPVARKPALRRQ